MLRHKRDEKVKKQMAQKRAKRTPQSIPQQRRDQPLPLPTCNSALETLPAELFTEIAILLPHQSIISLSQVALTFRKKLSFENGNHTFYQALPAVLLMQEEKDEKTTVRGGFAATTAAGGPTQQAAATALPASASPGSAFTTPTATFSSFASSPSAHELQSPLTSFASLSLIHDPDCATKARQKVLALGGRYESLLDYRKQVILYSKEGGRCSVCLVRKDSRGQVPQHYWGRLMCGDCYDENSVTSFDLEAIGLSKQLFRHMKMSPMHQTADGTIVYYRPSVDALLYSQTDCGLTQRILNHKARITAIYFARLETTKIEAERRQVRIRIVEAAESLWNGIDPYPVEIKNIFGDVVSLETNPTLPPADHWAVFRNRFCPTAALKFVLFPKALLTTRPTLAPVQHGNVWLDDPTSTFKQGDSHRVSGQWITAAALGMLYALTDFNHAQYGEVGMGGSCTVWKELANEWHTNRLDTDLASQAIIKMRKITPYMRHANDGMHRGIANLRERLGLRRIPKDQQHLSENNATVRRSVFAKLDGYTPDFQYKLGATEDAVNKYFHRIARNACTRCPISSFLFYPVGFSGLLDHMRTHHPADFWNGNIDFLL